MKYIILILLSLFTLNCISQVYIFKSYVKSETSEKIIDSTLFKKENRLVVKKTIWGNWYPDKTIIMFDLDKSTLSLLGDMAMIYTLQKDSIGSDNRVMAMVGTYDNKSYYIRIIRQGKGGIYHLYIDSSIEKSFAYEMIMIERVEPKNQFQY